MLEDALLAQVAAVDPKFALQMVEQNLDKGELSRTLADVLRQIQKTDKEAGAKLEDKIVKKLQGMNLVQNVDALSLAGALLQNGPLADNAVPSKDNSAVLHNSAYQDLLNAAIDGALKATPQSNVTAQRRQQGRGRSNAISVTPQNNPAAPTEAQVEQANARRLLGTVRNLMPQVEQLAPGRLSAVRQKLTEVGMTEAPRGQQMNQLSSLMQQGTSQSLATAAASAPRQAQARIYRMAAMRALDEGNTDFARQIANDHLEPAARDAVLKSAEARELAKNSTAKTLDDVRQTMVAMPSDNERVAFLLRLAESNKKDNRDFALQVLDQARELTSRRATSYAQFQLQLSVANAFSALGSNKAFDVLEPGITQLNEMLAAAAVLSGFEVGVFRDGEMPLQGGTGLADTVRRYSQQIGALSTVDFQRAETLAGRFQFSEPRVLARLAMARTLLGIPAPSNQNTFRNFGNLGFMRQ
jgi:hypothetical protein